MWLPGGGNCGGCREARRRLEPLVVGPVAMRLLAGRVWQPPQSGDSRSVVDADTGGFGASRARTVGGDDQRRLDIGGRRVRASTGPLVGLGQRHWA